MASVTAFIVLGNPHPNDNGISPEWLIELWEGHVATLKLKSLVGSKRAKIYRPRSSKDIFKTIKDILEDVYPDSTQKTKQPYLKSLVVTCLQGSTLESEIKKFSQLTRLDSHLSLKVASRTYSQWSNTWN